MKTILSEWKDADYDAMLSSFLTVATENADALGLSQMEIEQLTALVSQYASALTEVISAKAHLTAAVTKKDNCRESNHQFISKLSMRFRAQDEISDELLVKLNLAPHEISATHSAPQPVEYLLASAEENGLVKLRWNRGQNRKGTLFIVQTSKSLDGGWETVTAVTKTKCEVNSIPGVPQFFRVVAKRGDRVSAPSRAASAWAGSSSPLSRAA